MNTNRRTGLPRSLLAALVLLAAALLGWWLFGYRPAVTTAAGGAVGTLQRGVERADLNVLFITLDTTRPDRIGAYGDRRASTPNLDRLAAEGVIFEQAVAAVPLTLPAHATLFTGLRPPQHGVRDNGGYTLDPRHTTLATVMKDARRSTAAFVSAFVLDSRWGLDQGFDQYFDSFDLARYTNRSLGQISRRGGDVVDAATTWLDAHASSPFFAWVHFYDPHAPYDPPEPYKSRFADRPYAGEMAYMDAQVGRLLQWIDARRLAERTIVVAVGDHGESLGEHAENTHGIFVYDATMRIPLIIRAPYSTLRGRRVGAVVRSEDVMPTVIDLVGAGVPHAVQGSSLVTLMTGAVGDLNLDAYSESLYPRAHYGWSDLRALRSGRFKYIEAPTPELYDLERDPGERHNLYGDRRALASRMAVALGRLSAESPAPVTPSAVDPETRERLAALGYIGTVTRPAPTGAVLADPKDKIDIFNLMTSAADAGGTGDSLITRLELVLAKDPAILDAWLMLGNEHFRRGAFGRALEQYQRALRLDPGFDLATINLAAAYRALGNYDAAIAGFERYLLSDPRNAWVRYQLGELYVDLGKLPQAEAAFRQSLADDTRVAAARNALGVVAFKRGDLATAETEVRAALAQKPDVRLAHFNLALIAEERRDVATAAREYQQEIDTQPNAYKAAFNLGKLHEQSGNQTGAESAFRMSVTINPRFAEGYLFLAKFYLDHGRSLDEAAALARRGIETGPAPEFAPLGHYILADVFSRQGRAGESARQAAMGRALQLRARSVPRPHLIGKGQ